jgi:hypothetical protein
LHPTSWQLSALYESEGVHANTKFGSHFHDIPQHLFRFILVSSQKAALLKI